ncbi:MAG: GNAT family N-acetyltransferase [Anaerolineae bacterium]|nr:GNAT family N-acetyltransferase [Anaerolineae bacterium]
MATLIATALSASGLRPVNLKTDLAPLADLMEIAFAESMDSSGRAAIREMRTLSRLGSGVNLLSGVNDLVLGIGLGYVWLEDGKLIGNVSIYPSNLPSHLPRSWVIANVAVHPDYRGRGIARRLMEASLEAIGHRGDILLQVEERNEIARNLYTSLNFHEEGTFTIWRRPGSAHKPPLLPQQSAHITRRTRGEWEEELELARRSRAGGYDVGWLRPIDAHYFRKSLLKSLLDIFSLRSDERLIIRSEQDRRLLASLWIERAFGSSTTRLTLLVEEDYAALHGETMLSSVCRRFEGETLSIEHPTHDAIITFLLQRLMFQPQRTLVHMRHRA